MNISKIIKAWSISFNPSEEQLQVAEERLAACNECEFKKTIASIDICSVCLCPISKKVFAEGNDCPDGRWKIIGGNSSENKNDSN